MLLKHMLQHGSIGPSFILLSSNPPYGYNTICSLRSGSLQFLAIRNNPKSFCRYMVPFLLGKYSGMKLLIHMVKVYLSY